MQQQQQQQQATSCHTDITISLYQQTYQTLFRTVVGHTLTVGAIVQVDCKVQGIGGDRGQCRRGGDVAATDKEAAIFRWPDIMIVLFLIKR